MDGFGPDYPRTVWEVFGDYNGRRMALIKALTIDAKEFIRQCDPDKANLCLFGLPNGQWKIDLPPEKVPPDLPEPALGINFARDGMQEKDWLAYVAIHSDAWLLSLASYFGARCYFDKTDRKCLFDMINDLPTVLEVVIQYAKHKQQAISLERMSGPQQMMRPSMRDRMKRTRDRMKRMRDRTKRMKTDMRKPPCADHVVNITPPMNSGLPVTYARYGSMGGASISHLLRRSTLLSSNVQLYDKRARP
ncbi:PHD finger protein ALFIN-LIKE 9-like [Salvia splendens]|uniref:PHD finger protein ALFIN-LIKE 9-like n=1 Tax=Salvia splendens TaxID=180675 RepID=UPI001C25A883|nr:PHD finger protein ALFIN-LIKE 9-like [Salvia splendens]